MRSGRSRRTSGSPPVIRSFSTPSETNDPGGALDLLEGQDLVARQERVVAPEDLLGHAVGASEVAAIGDRDAQVAHRAAERVGRSGSAIEGQRGVHRPMVARKGAEPGGTTGSGPLVPLANCTVPTLAATMRTKSRISGRPARRPLYEDRDPWRKPKHDRPSGFPGRRTGPTPTSRSTGRHRCAVERIPEARQTPSRCRQTPADRPAMDPQARKARRLA